MSNVIAFPSVARNRTEAERAIREYLTGCGASAVEADTIVSNMDEFFSLLDFGFDFSISDTTPAATRGQFDRLAILLQERSNRLTVERVNREMDHLGLGG